MSWTWSRAEGVVDERHLGRELALRVLFQLDAAGAPQAAAESWPAVLAYEAAECGARARSLAFAQALVAGVLRERTELDRTLTEASSHWSLDQMTQVDRTILRLAAYELQEGTGTPVGVAINEAVELAKVYSGRDAGRFVNGVLGRVARRGAAPGGRRAGSAGR